MERSAGVYVIRCTATGEIYVGRTTDLAARKVNHWSDLRRGRHRNKRLQAAWARYGEGAFEFEVLETVADPNRLHALEAIYIASLGAADKGKGFNVRVHPVQRFAGAGALIGMLEAAARPCLTTRHYAVLASLEQEPRSGYEIAQWFANVTKHFCAFGHSSVYPTLADLERRGLVAFTEMPSEQGPTRKVYRLTPGGREALLEWVAQPAADAEVRDEQLLKALCYGFLPPERAIELLRLARARHTERSAYYEQVVRSAEADMQAGDRHTAAAALGRMLTARRGVSAQESYAAWCDEAIAAIASMAAGTAAGERE